MALFVLRGQLRKISPPSKVEVLLTVTEHQAGGLCFLRTASDTGLSSGFYSILVGPIECPVRPLPCPVGPTACQEVTFWFLVLTENDVSHAY